MSVWTINLTERHPLGVGASFNMILSLEYKLFKSFLHLLNKSSLKEVKKMLECLLVGIGGFIGSVLRYLIGLLPIKPDNGFPVKTLFINICGAFIISIIVAIAAKNKSLNPNLILMLKVGVCGGFTTFSTFAYETAELMQKGNVMTAVSYALLSVVLGVLVIYFAQMIIN